MYNCKAASVANSSTFKRCKGIFTLSSYRAVGIAKLAMYKAKGVSPSNPAMARLKCCFCTVHRYLTMSQIQRCFDDRATRQLKKLLIYSVLRLHQQLIYMVQVEYSVYQ